MSRSRTSWRLLALALPLAACSSDDDPPAVNLFDGYSSGSIAVPVRLAIADQSPVNPAAAITGYTITPALPMGLTFNDTTGVIGGTPEGVSAAVPYTVTATDGTNNDAETITITVRTPSVGLSTDRSLTRVATIIGTPVDPTGAGVGQTGTAPAASVTTLTETVDPMTSAASVLAESDASDISATAAPTANDATADFIATVTIDDTELDAGDPWTFAAQAPYDDDGLAPALPNFAVDTSSVVIEDGTLTLDVELTSGATTIGPFDSGSLPTDLRSVEPLTSEQTFVGFSWTELAGAYYTTLTEAGGDTEVYRYDADGGVGGVPSFEQAFDLDDMEDGFASIIGAVGSRLIVTMDDAAAVSKTYSYDPATDELVQVADLRTTLPDNNSNFVDLGGNLYFVGEDAADEFNLYRYTYAAGGNPATLEDISTTSEGTNGDEPENLTVFGGMLHYTALDSTLNRNLYRFDPATDTQELISDVALAPISSLVSDGGALYATADTAGGGSKLFVWNATDEALQQISDLAADDAANDGINLLQAGPTGFYFTGVGVNGEKLYLHTPSTTPMTIEQVSDTAGMGTDDNVSQLTEMNGQFFFSADNDMGASKLWLLNTTTGQISQVTDINGAGTSDAPGNLTPIGTTRLAFSATTGAESELFIYDLNTGETIRAADVNAGASDLAIPVATLGGRVVFRAETAGGAAFYAAD